MFRANTPTTSSKSTLKSEVDLEDGRLRRGSSVIETMGPHKRADAAWSVSGSLLPQAGRKRGKAWIAMTRRSM